MILLDFSAVMHQCIFSAISTIKPKEVDGDYTGVLPEETSVEAEIEEDFEF